VPPRLLVTLGKQQARAGPVRRGPARGPGVGESL